ncbi:hypothetical protein M405DRAFT_870515 [Rhizopogon salebrosus TDB-379]|nr:hypothetical protein M405DRAFT_870515 [Rhizopogon salebrosus TDB-379]
MYNKDSKSSNGAFINEERLSPEGVGFELKNAPIIAFGTDVILAATCSPH